MLSKKATYKIFYAECTYVKNINKKLRSRKIWRVTPLKLTFFNVFFFFEGNKPKYK